MASVIPVRWLNFRGAAEAERTGFAAAFTCPLEWSKVHPLAVNIYAMKKPKRINSVSVGLSLIAALVVYAGWALLPVFWPLWQVSGMMHSACALAYVDGDDASVMRQLLKDTRRTKLAVDEDNFLLERVPYPEEELLDANPGLRDRMRSIGSQCRIRFRYDSSYRLPLLDFEYRIPYASTVTLDLRRNDGGGNALNDFFYNSCTCTSARRGR